MSNTKTVNKVPRGRPAKREVREQRIPLSGSRKRMHIDAEDQDPNFHYSWINDSRGLIQRALRAGYVHVTVEEMPSWGNRGVDAADPVSSTISMTVGPDLDAFMMKQPMEYYLEDQKTKHDLVTKRESSMKRELNSGNEGTYGDVKIS